MPKWDLYILLQGKKSDEDFTAASIQKTGCHRSPDGEAPLFSETAYARASVQNGDRRINYDIFSEQKRVEGIADCLQNRSISFPTALRLRYPPVGTLRRKLLRQVKSHLWDSFKRKKRFFQRKKAFTLKKSLGLRVLLSLINWISLMACRNYPPCFPEKMSCSSIYNK